MLWRILVITMLSTLVVGCGEGQPIAAVEPAGQIAIDSLLLPSDQLPAPPQDDIWGKIAQDYGNGEDLFFGERDYRIRHWRPSSNVNSLAQIVRRYDDAAAAEVERRNAPYGRIIVDNDNGHGEIVPVDITSVPLAADAAALACVGRGADLMKKCGFWEFRGRYGAYLVDVVFSLAVGLHGWQQLPRDDFLRVVTAVDTYVNRTMHE